MATQLQWGRFMRRNRPCREDAAAEFVEDDDGEVAAQLPEVVAACARRGRGGGGCVSYRMVTFGRLLLVSGAGARARGRSNDTSDSGVCE